jgi:hypothetical protein
MTDGGRKLMKLKSMESNFYNSPAKIEQPELELEMLEEVENESQAESLSLNKNSQLDSNSACDKSTTSNQDNLSLGGSMKGSFPAFPAKDSKIILTKPAESVDGGCKSKVLFESIEATQEPQEILESTRRIPMPHPELRLNPGDELTTEEAISQAEKIYQSIDPEILRTELNF